MNLNTVPERREHRDVVGTSTRASHAGHRASGDERRRVLHARQANKENWTMRVSTSMRTAAVSLALAAQLMVGSSGAIQVLAADTSVPSGVYGEGPGATGLLGLPGA